MEKYKLTKEDYNNLNKIINIENKILNIYEQLEKLESSNKKDSEEFKQALNSLQMLLILEEMLYKKLDGDPRRLSELLFYISGYNQININDYFKIEDCLNEELITARIRIRLEMMLSVAKFPELNEDDIFIDNIELNDEESINSSFEDNVEGINLNFNELPDPDTIEEQYFYSEKLGHETEKDMLNTILVILSEYLLNPEYKNIYHLLIKFKYQLSFLFKEIELVFSQNNFDINQILFWGANMVVDNHNSNPEDLELARDSYAEEILYEQGENFRELLFEDINDINIFGKAIICQIIVRASLLFVKNKTRQSFVEYMMMEIYYAKTNNIDMTEIIRNSLNKVDADKELPHILRLKLD